ncbi:MAG TPA: nucleotidyltransferase domain-containing protein [Candidatus Acidoferrales bacterium]|nr:nucleotidyltransferase domain-containing protein [Candidatus Acidoferrales bacterium]
MEKDLAKLVEKLERAAGANLKLVVLYGSAASGDYQPKHSDLNVLCVLERLGAAELAALHPAAAWWARKGHPAPLVFTLDELRHSADVFAIELLDIKASHRRLFGEDVLGSFEVPMNLHRQQVERELRTNVIRLRQSFLAGPRDTPTLQQLMIASASTFAALFRHALLALGEQPPGSRRAVVNRIAALLGLDAASFHAVLDVREGKPRGGREDVLATFGSYLAAVTRAAEEIDRRLAEPR